MIDRINSTNLTQLASFNHGEILLERIQLIMNCKADSNQPTCQHISTAIIRVKESAAKNYCGVNPVTGKYGIRDDAFVRGKLRPGGLGNIRPGNGGAGGFQERSKKGHSGVDITAPVGTAVVASHSGKIIKIVDGFKLANTPAARSAQNGGYGNAVTIKYDNGIYGYYSHLTTVSASIKASPNVKQGDSVGTAGRTGNANNKQQPSQDDHLHYGRFSEPFDETKGRPNSTQKTSWIDPVKSLNNPCK